MTTKKNVVLRILSSSHAIEIIRELSKSPLRFVDLEHVCRSRKTRYIRLRELEQENLVRAVPKLQGHRSYSYYEMTDKGIHALELAEKLLSLNIDEAKKGQRR